MSLRSIGQISDALTGLLPTLGRANGIIDDGVRLRQYPSAAFVDNVERYARVLTDASLDLAAHGHHGLSRTLGHDGLSVARKAGVMHGMNEHRNWFSSGWYGAFDGVIDDVTRAVQQLT